MHNTPTLHDPGSIIEIVRVKLLHSLFRRVGWPASRGRTFLSTHNASLKNRPKTAEFHLEKSAQGKILTHFA
jgi:hypothetical protein